MNPEQLKALAALVEQVRATGKTDREINSILRRNRNISINSVRQLNTELRAQGLDGAGEPATAPPVSNIDRIQGQLANFIQGGTFGFANDVIGAVSPELEGRFQNDLEVARREDPVLSFGSTVAGGLIPGVGVAKAGGLLRSGLGLQRFGQGAGLVRRAATGAAQVGAVGATEAGLFAAGNADDGGLEGRLDAAKRAAPIGGGLGLVTGGLLGAAAGAQQARRAVQEGGSRLAGRAAREAGIASKPSVVRAGIDKITQRGQALMRPLEAAGANAVPAEAVQQLIESPLLRRELRRIGTPASRKVTRQIDQVIEGTRNSVEGLTFEMLDDIRQGVKFQADRIATRIPDARGRLPSRGLINASESELQILDEALDAVPGFTESRSLFARAGTARRGLKEGRKAFRQAADDFESAFNKLPNDGARKAFREGGLAELTKSLNQGGKVETFLTRAGSPGSETQQKLRVILGSDEAFDGFMTAVRTEKGILTKAKVIETVAKWAGFAFGGSSIIGGGLVLGIQ